MASMQKEKQANEAHGEMSSSGGQPKGRGGRVSTDENNFQSCWSAGLTRHAGSYGPAVDVKARPRLPGRSGTTVKLLPVTSVSGSCLRRDEHPKR